MWNKWTDLKKMDTDFPTGTLVSEIVITTVDSIRYSHLLRLMIDNNYPLLFCGPTGTGKSIYVKNLLNSLDSTKYLNIPLGFSAKTTAQNTQDIIDDKVVKIRKGV
jgi:dynein heavy chain